MATLTETTPDERRRFRHICAAGITFQGGTAAVDSSTIMAALAYQLTGSPIAVGAVTTILRVGWLAPQLFVGYFAERSGASLPYFIVGGFGRATCLALLAVLLAFAPTLPALLVTAGFFLTWTAYSFVSGIVAVPYNDIVGRSVASERRSRLLAIRFFGGGLLALLVAALANSFVEDFTFPASYAAIVGLAAVLMYVSSMLFIWPGEPEAAANGSTPVSFVSYLREGWVVFQTDVRFRRFVFSQWGGGLAMMALPFYVLTASELHLPLADVALLLGAQSVGALLANPVWGWWGDRVGKRQLLEGVAILRLLPPLAALALIPWTPTTPVGLLVGFVTIFFVLGALSNGLTIAVLGWLMEISPDPRRRAYSGYFNALTAPAYLLPLLGGLLVVALDATAVFVLAAVGAGVQWAFVRSTKYATNLTA